MEKYSKGEPDWFPRYNCLELQRHRDKKQAEARDTDEALTGASSAYAGTGDDNSGSGTKAAPDGSASPASAIEGLREEVRQLKDLFLSKLAKLEHALSPPDAGSDKAAGRQVPMRLTPSK